MNVKRIWTLGIGSVVGIFLFVACGASATSTLVPTPVPTPAPAATAALGSGQTGVATPSPAASLGDAESTQASAETANGYVWQVSTVDDNEAKQLLTRVQTGQVPQEAWPAVSAPAFFHVLRMDVFFVYTTDPMIWERIGFPGAAIDHGGYRDIHRFPEPTP